MKLACQLGMAPGESVSEKMRNIAKYGFEGVELDGRALLEGKAGEVKKALRESKLAASSICAGYRGCPLDPDPAVRRQSIDDMQQLLTIGADLGVVDGLVMVPIFGGPRLPNLTPLADAIDLEKQLLVPILQQVAGHAEKVGCTLLVEPLNRYETHLLRTLDDAVAICKKVKSPRVQIMADFFHMHIEELSTPESIAKAGKFIHHIHLADNTREQPGTGDIDFAAGFAALKKTGYDKYMALECGVIGDREKALPECVKFLRKCIG